MKADNFRAAIEMLEIALINKLRMENKFPLESILSTYENLSSANKGAGNIEAAICHLRKIVSLLDTPEHNKSPQLA